MPNHVHTCSEPLRPMHICPQMARIPRPCSAHRCMHVPRPEDPARTAMQLLTDVLELYACAHAQVSHAQGRGAHVHKHGGSGMCRSVLRVTEVYESQLYPSMPLCSDPPTHICSPSPRRAHTSSKGCSQVPAHMLIPTEVSYTSQAGPVCPDLGATHMHSHVQT